MGSYLAEQHARFLSDNDVVTLFGMLQKTLGTRKDAARECGLTRKAIYDWSNLKQEIKQSTKVKILDRSLHYIPVDAMDYLTRQTTDSTSEVLMSYLLMLYENALQKQDPVEFEKLANKFDQVKIAYAGLIYKRYERELDELSAKLEAYGNSIGSKWRFGTSYLYDTKALKTVVLETLKFLTSPENGETSESLAARLGIPLDIINNAKEILKRNRNEVMHLGYSGSMDWWDFEAVADLNAPYYASSVIGLSAPLKAPADESAVIEAIPSTEPFTECRSYPRYVKMSWNESIDPRLQCSRCFKEGAFKHVMIISDQYSFQRNTASGEHNRKLLTAANVQGVESHGK